MTNTFFLPLFSNHSKVETTLESNITVKFAPTTDIKYFFQGTIKNKILFRDLMIFLNEVVEARFFRPDLWRYLDPVITCEKNNVRFECFSSCASVYARVDLESGFFENYELKKRGTTNVNFNKDFINALMTLKQNNEVSFEVGKDEVLLKSDSKESKEKKVKLPERWVKGFLQSQAIFSKANLVFTLNSIQAKQFITSITNNNKDKTYIISKGSNIQFVQVKPTNISYIQVSGLHRLKLLAKIIPNIKNLSIYKSDSSGVTLWVITCDNAIITLALSEQVSSGFSGEGEALRNISFEQDNYALSFAENIIKNLDYFNTQQLSNILEMNLSKTEEIIDFLSENGLIGYDCLKKTYFYRELPLKKLLNNTRVTKAKDLLSKNSVKLEDLKKKEDGFFAKGLVTGKTDSYLTSVEVKNGYITAGTCNCEWVRKNEGIKRGPCKHIISLRFFVEKEDV